MLSALVVGAGALVWPLSMRSQLQVPGHWPLLASDESSYMTGQTLHVDGGWAVGRYPVEHKIEL